MSLGACKSIEHTQADPVNLTQYLLKSRGLSYDESDYKKYDGSFGIDFVAFITILLRNKYGCMLKRKEIDMKFSSLDTPIGEDITMKDTLEDDFSMENDFEHREEMEALLKAISNLEDEEREFILYINEERGNMQKYYEEHKNEMTFNAVRYKKKKIMDKIQKALKKKGIKVK